MWKSKRMITIISKCNRWKLIPRNIPSDIFDGPQVQEEKLKKYQRNL